MPVWSKVIRILIGIAVLGFVVSYPPFLAWLAEQAIWVVFLIWYVILFLFIVWTGITLAPARFRVRHAIGFIVLYFGLATILGFVDNPYLSPGITGAQVTPVEAGLEETLITSFYYQFTQDPNLLIFLVYILTPVLFALVALWILKPKFFTKAFHRLVGP